MNGAREADNPQPADVQFPCDYCEQPLAAPPDMIGQSIACPACGATIVIPRPEPPALPPLPFRPLRPSQRPRYRVTLTKRDTSDPIGRRLLELLIQITADGELSLGEIEQLKALLDEAMQSSAIPAIGFLTESLAEIMDDGRITMDERLELLDAIERVLPAGLRTAAQAKRRKAGEIAPAAADDDTDRASGRQLAYIRALGGVPLERMSFEEASAMIDELKMGQRPTSRQLMVLRFWNRLDLADLTREEVSQWMDQWYAGDPDRLRAWELFKSHTEDSGRQGDPERVPLGAGGRYLIAVRG